MYEVYLERAAERDMKGLSKEDSRRIIQHIKSLAENQRPAGCRRLAGSASDWRIRVGDFRIIYEIDEKTKAVKVMRVRHRKESYR